MKRIGIVAAAVLPMVVAAVAPAATAGQRIDRVGFLVAGLLAGFGLTRLTGLLDPAAVVGRAAARAADADADGADTSATVVDDVPAERPVLFDQAAAEPAATANEAESAPSDRSTVEEAAPAVAAAPATAPSSTRKPKGKSRAKGSSAPAAPVAAEPAGPADPGEVRTVDTTDAAPVSVAADAPADVDAPADAVVAALETVDTVDDSGAAVEVASGTDEVDPVDIVGIAARTLASQLAPGTRTPSPTLSALDTGRAAAPARATPPARPADKARPAADQPVAAPVRGAAPPTSRGRNLRAETPAVDDDRAGDARPTGDDASGESTDSTEASVVELLAKRAASTGSSVWSLAMNGTGGPASWALAPNAEAARKAAEDAVREAVDNAGRAEADPAADSADRGTSPIVGRVPRRDA